MASREGNVLKVPGRTIGTEVKGTEILGSYARFTQKGLTLLKNTTNPVYEAGTLLKVSGTAKKYTAVVAADLTGTPTITIVGVLRKGVDVGSSDMLANYVDSGIVKVGMLKTATGAALTAPELAAVAGLLNGRVDTVHNYLIF